MEIESFPGGFPTFRIYGTGGLLPIDWSKADATNTIEAVQLYLEQHPDGEHFDEANDKLKTLNANTVSPVFKSSIP